MPSHASLTGADLHEPKGADAASANTVYVADGAGSGTWQKVDSDQIDTASIKNINKGVAYTTFVDIGTAGSIYIPFPNQATINKITTIVETAPLTTDTVLTAYNSAGLSMGTITIAFTGAAAGDIDTVSPVSNNTVSAGSYIRIASDGGCSNTVRTVIAIDYTLT